MKKAWTIATAVLGYTVATLFPLPDFAVCRLWPDRLDFALQSVIDRAHQRTTDKLEAVEVYLTVPSVGPQEEAARGAARVATDEEARLISLLGIRAPVCSWL